MKKRVFYVVNLDRNRILVLGVLIAGFLSIAFATGYRFGTSAASPVENRDLSQMSPQDEVLMDPSRQGLDRSVPDEPSLSPPASAGERTGRSQDRSESADRENRLVRNAPETRERRPERREPARREPAREPARESARDEKRNQSRESRVSRTDREKKETRRREEKSEKVQRPAKAEPQKARKDEKASRSDRKTEAVKLEPERGMRLSNTGTEPAAPAAKPVSLQLGSFTSRAAADRMEGQLKRQGFTPVIASVNGKFAVRVGRSASEAEIARIEKQLKQKNYNPVRVTLP